MTSSKRTPVISFSDVAFKYPGARQNLLEEISLDIFQGERVGIIGGNGCGKSTLGKLLLSVHRPTKGTIEILGAPATWKRHIAELGYVGDPGHNAQELGLPTGLTVEQVLQTIKALCRGENNQELMDDLVQNMGLESLRHRKISHLSTGERKRLMICLTFLRKPTLVILDEPFDGLDKNVTSFIKRLMNKVIQDKKVTLFFISHSRIEIDTYVDRVYELNEKHLTLVTPQNFEGFIRTEKGQNELSGRTGKIMGDIMNRLQSKTPIEEIAIELKSVKI